MQLDLPAKIAVATKICNEYARGKHTIASICESFKVSERTFSGWTHDWEGLGLEKPKAGFIAEVAKLFKQCKQQKLEANMDNLRELTMTSLALRIKGTTYEEVTTELKEQRDPSTQQMVLVPKGVKKVTKVVQPSDTAIIFATKNVLPKYFSDTVHQHHSGEIARPYADMSDKQLEELLNKIKKVG